MHLKSVREGTMTLGTLRLRIIYTSVGVTSAIVFERDLIVVVQIVKNKRSVPLFHNVVAPTEAVGLTLRMQRYYKFVKYNVWRLKKVYHGGVFHRRLYRITPDSHREYLSKQGDEGWLQEANALTHGFN